MLGIGPVDRVKGVFHDIIDDLRLIGVLVRFSLLEDVVGSLVKVILEGNLFIDEELN